MKIRALLFAALATAPLSACGGHKTEKPTPSPVAAPSDDDARRAFENPGGMWMPAQMTLPVHEETLKKLGVQISGKALSDPLSAPLAAVVQLSPPGCTGSFVSNDGLVVTNHHCVQTALQINSTPTTNLIQDGYVAKTKADEKTAGPAQRVFVLQSYKDVTKEMRDGLDAIADAGARELESQNRSKALMAACEKDRPGTRCRVGSFFRDGLYQLFEYLEIRDVRLVYAPARSVGDYGGEIDNWEWPRHTGDWSYFRAYVGKDGKPADFSPDNVPYKPAHHLQVTTAGLKPADFVMITGYPGMTNRTDTAAELHASVEFSLPYAIAFSQGLYKIAELHLKDAGETAIKAEVRKQSIQNGLEKREGTLANIEKDGLLAKKDALDAKVKAWAAQAGHEKQKADIEKAEALVATMRKTEKQDAYRRSSYNASAMLSTAIQLVYWASERPKADAERREGYQDRDMPRSIAQQKQFARQYDVTLDKESFEFVLVRALDLPEAERPWLPVLLGAKKKVDAPLILKTVEGWYAQSKLADEKTRLEMLQKGTLKSLAASKDPFIAAALRIWATYKNDEKTIDARRGEMLVYMPSYTEGMRDVLGGALAPDANSTLRVTYGTVRSLRSNVDAAFTYASQILKKDTGTWPFNSPAKLLEAIKKKDFGAYADATGDLPIDFLSDLDITGGNSGSPVLNGKGELVGLAFDGNKEGVASDVVFNGKTTRTIQVDARYMIWTMEHLDGAAHLVQEMGLPVRMK